MPKEAKQTEDKNPGQIDPSPLRAASVALAERKAELRNAEERSSLKGGLRAEAEAALAEVERQIKAADAFDDQFAALAQRHVVAKLKVFALHAQSLDAEAIFAAAQSKAAEAGAALKLSASEAAALGLSETWTHLGKGIQALAEEIHVKASAAGLSNPFSLFLDAAQATAGGYAEPFIDVAIRMIQSRVGANPRAIIDVLERRVFNPHRSR